ncbi:autotransporter domain-containing protein [Prosthecobacter sp.]|uniref:autotransporter domain-containing protein n=1 Tax=Prosthecobacter sp. TaxID=1965333 RepID=UPI0037838C28
MKRHHPLLPSAAALSRPGSPFLHRLRTRALRLQAGLLGVCALLAGTAMADHPVLPTVYWLGQANNLWSNKNWATDSAGTPTNLGPESTTDVFFSAAGAANLATTLDQNFSVKSLTVNGTMSISGSSKLALTGDTRVDNGSMTLNAGVILSSVNSLIGTDPGQSGSVTVTGADAQWNSSADLNVGFQGANTSLTISDGGLVSANFTKIGGYVSSTGNVVTVTGSGSQLLSTNDLLVGYGGNGNTLTISDGATATNVNAFVGFRFDAASSSNDNSVSVTGPGSLWTNTGTFYLGEYGTGNSLSVSDGGKVTVTGSGKDAVVGDQAGSTGNSLTVTGAGSEFSNAATFYLGKSGGGNTLSVLNGGTMTTNNVRLGGNAGSDSNSATVSGSGSVWNISGTQFRVGSGGSGNTVTISSGGAVNVTTGLTLLGRDVGSNNNTLTITGAGSTLTTTELTIGRNGTGNTLTVADGGSLSTTGSGNILIAENSGSSGTLQIGNGAAAGQVSATTITGGAGTAVLKFNHTDTAYTFSPAITGTVSLEQDGTGTTILTAKNDYSGTTDVKAGALVVDSYVKGSSTFTVASGAILAGTGFISITPDHSMYLNGVLSVGDFTATPGTASSLMITTSGTGGIVMGAGSAIVVDLFTGAGNGDNTGITGASDQLSLRGTLDATAGGVLYLHNPNAMTAFAIGDQWKVVNLNSGEGSITGTLGVNDGALGLAALGYIAVLDSATGIVTIEDHRAQFSATESGLPMANSQNQAVIGSMQAATGDVNNHLFNLRNGGGEESSDGSIASSLDEGVVMGQGDGPEDPIARRVKRSRQWEVFTTVNYGNVRLSPISSQAGVQVDSWATSLGLERHLSRGLAVGFAVTFLNSHQVYTGGLGKLDLEGPTLSAYASYVRHAFWSSLLYSFGDYDLSSQRNPGFGLPVASGDTRAYTHAVQFNTGWNFRFQNNTLVTGPFVGIDYLHGSVNAYTETGGGLGALSYGRQSFQSLVTRVGWSASKKFRTDWAEITPQFRLSYERQNLKNNGTSVQSITAPFSASGGNQIPGQDYMVLGAGVNFQFTPAFNMQLGYQTQIFRNNMTSTFGSVRFGYRF